MRKKIIYSVIVIASVSLFNLSCRKDVTKKGQQEFPYFPKYSNPVRRISVSNKSQFYEAINNPGNAGSLIMLSAGTYILDDSYPNAGRIELLENMQLQGQPGHPEKVIIDASFLPGTSFTPPLGFPAARTGAIRLGRGFNAIEWLTVKGNESAQALSIIETDLIWTGGPSQIKVEHTIITGGRIGLDIRNVGTASAGRILEAEINNNEIMENLVQQGQGMEIQNANGASGAVIRATLNGNYVHNNKIGLRSFNNNANNTNTDDGTITIQSANDRFEENGIGLYIIAGLNQATTTTCNGNLIRFDAHGTSIKNNQGMLPPAPEITPPCGLFAVGGNVVSSGLASNNKLDINLWDCIISGNHGAADIIAYGAFSPLTLPAGIHNIVEIQLHGMSQKATDIATPSLPTEPAGTNIARITR